MADFCNTTPRIAQFARCACPARLAVPLILLLVVNAVLSPAAGAEERPLQVGVLYWSMNIPGQVAMRQGLEEELKRINQAVTKNNGPTLALTAHVAGDDESGIERQIEQMNELVDAGMDIIIVQPTDNAALTGPLRRANARNIPVIAYDQYISGGKLTAYLTSDNYQAGYLDGEYIAHIFEDSKTIKLILVEYPHVSSTVERVNGFLDALGERKQPYTILRTYNAVEPVSGKRAGEAILKDFPDKHSVDVVFTVNDGGGLAVVDVLAGAGRQEVTVATIDGDPASIKNIESGRLTRIDSAQFCGALGAEAMKTAYRVLQGKDVPAHTLIPVFPITRETRNRYPGWMGDIPAPFEKPWPSRTPTWVGAPRAATARE